MIAVANRMPNPSEIVERIMQTAKVVLPESVGYDVKANLKAAIVEIVSELDVVTREEFDIQKQVLMRTRMKVEQLEESIKKLEM